jgi:hypothetical protein
MSVGAVSSMSVMAKSKPLLKICELASVTLTVILRHLVVSYAVDGNMLKLAKTVDYETTKSLSITVRVTDNNSHTFDKNFTFTITVPNSNNNSPTDIILSIGNSTDNHTIAENTTANTDLGTLSTTG